MPSIAATAAGAAAFGTTGLSYAALIERNLFTLRRFTVPVLPPAARPVRLLHLTDLHLMPAQRRKADWVRGLAELEPDLVVNTGDNIADPRSIDVLLRAFEPLMRVPGVFVMGSNDYFAPRLKNPGRYLTRHHRRGLGDSARLPTARLVAGLAAGGWTELSNRRATLSVAGSDLEFVGVDDPHLRYDRYERVSGPADPAAALTIGVSHAPYQRVLDAMTADGAGLVMAGHTHGGQLCLPFWGALVTNCDLDTRRAKGVSRWWPGAGSAPAAAAPSDAAYLEVSAGLGTSPMAPVRFACRPEATLLTLAPRHD
ncbi:MAG: metallophosphoesterase [Actinomycetales bacterium]|nr:metallophosphoesterase [Actinomycetales bacterium]